MATSSRGWRFLDCLSACRAGYCLIGAVAINHHIAKVVPSDAVTLSLNFEVVVASDKLAALQQAATTDGFVAQPRQAGLSLRHPSSDASFLVLKDPRLQAFLAAAKPGKVFRNKVVLASREDLVQAKLWQLAEHSRISREYQTHLTDLHRLLEAYPALAALVPPALQPQP